MQIPETEITIRGGDGVVLLQKTVPPGDYVLGCAPEVELPFEAELVSRCHARLTVNDDHVLVEDLGSDTGTFVNGQRVSDSTRLFPNQKIQIGSATVELHRVKAEVPPDVPPAPQTAAVHRLLPAVFLRDKKYEIGGVVAQGGMGAILDAKDAATERHVAMKVMLNGSLPDDLTRFVAEAKVTAQLEHPSIVPVYELSVDENGQAFYTMKMVRGITLCKVLQLLSDGEAKTTKKYPLPALLTIFQKVCDAIAFAHSRGVIHRDLKPENIMLDDFGVVLVMDWGLAKVLTRGGHRVADAPTPDRGGVTRSSIHTLPRETSGSTLVGTIMGTPQYMSPEQARGEVETLDARSDIYALGGILYHILTLRPPVGSNDAWTIVGKVAKGDIEPLSAPTPGRFSHLPGGRMPEGLTAVVRKAMSFERDQRYPRVADFQHDIEAYQNGRATRAENARFGKQLVLLVKRNQGIFSTAAAAWVIITALAVWFVIDVTRARNRAVQGELTARIERDRAGAEKARAETEKARAEESLAELRGTAPTFVAQATALVEAGRFEDALAKLRYAIQLDPKNSSYQLRRAHLLESSQHLAEAATAYREVLALDPTNRSARDNLALCERLQSENGGAPQLRNELQGQLVDALLREGRATEAGPLAAALGKGTDAIEATLRVRLKEYSTQPGWHADRILRQPNGTFMVNLDHLKLGDLSAFSGLPVSFLNLSNTDFKDLRVVARLPLTALELYNTQVTDLAPLRGLKLERLDLGNCRVADLEPLRGMPLRRLDIGNTKVIELDVLAGMPIEELVLRNASIKSIVPLRGLPLRHLDLTSVQGDVDMADLTECRELEDVVISRYAAHIEALRSLPRLAHLRLEGYQDVLIPAGKFWSEFKPEMEAVGTIRFALRKAGINLGTLGFVRAMPDGSVDVSLNKTSVTELDFLHGLPVSRLVLSGTTVRDLTPLRGMPLKFLIVSFTQVSDLEPLRGLPLTHIDLRGTKITSIAPLLDCSTLENIILPPNVRGFETLRELPKLRLLSFDADRVNYLPNKTAEQFWKEYDAKQEAGKK